MNINHNPYDMKCFLCGAPLVYSQFYPGTSIGLNKFIGFFSSDTHSSRKALICPNKHSYALTDVKQYIKANEIQISEDVVTHLKKQNLENFDVESLISNEETQVYAVTYSWISRLRMDRFKALNDPTPSNQVLDNVKIFICANAKYIMPNLERKNIIFAGVPVRLGRFDFTYKIVWYVLIGGKGV